MLLWFAWKLYHQEPLEGETARNVRIMRAFTWHQSMHEYFFVQILPSERGVLLSCLFFDERFEHVRSVSMEGERWSVTMPGGRLCGFAMQHPASELGHHIVPTGLGHVR